MPLPVSIGTNMLECGEDWRMGEAHLAPLAACGVTRVDMHCGARHERGGDGSEVRLTKAFLDFRDERHPRQVRRWLDRLGLQAVCLHTSPMGLLDLASPDEAIRSSAAQELGLMPRVCELLGVPVMVLHPGSSLRPDMSLDDQYDRLAKSLGLVLPEAERLGLRIALENLLPGSLSSDIGGLIEQVDRLGHPLVGICLDTGHAHVSGFGLVEAVSAIGPRLFALHVHDNDGTGDQHRPPLAGTIDWRGFADALRHVGYAGTLNLEVVDRDGGNPASEAFIRGAMDAARRVLNS